MEPQPLGVTCLQDGDAIEGCGLQTNVSLPGGFRAVTETLTLRVPAENESFLFSYGETGTLTQAFNIPERILGIDRDFWECFSDTSNVDTVWEEKQGIGCAAWAEETVRKWDQSSQVRVFVNGPDSFADEFKDALNALSPVVNLRFEWVGAESNADITAYIGIAIPELESQGVFCIDFEAFGCANTEFDPRSGEILGSEIIIYNLWPDLGVDFDDFSDGRRSDFRSAMIHEAVHALARMIHRTELLSIMNISVHERAELSPTDEALLRLHGHELVRPGMTLAEVEELIVFNDELIDPQPIDPRFTAWTLVSNAYRELREATSASFEVRSSFPGCSEEFGWADYKVGNLTRGHSYFDWMRIDNADNHVYILQADSGQLEYWSQSQSEWVEVGYDRVSDDLSGWRRDLSDPHHILESILYYADWSNAEISVDSEGRTLLQFKLYEVRGNTQSPADSAEITLIIDDETHLLLEYTLDWNLPDARCDTYRIEARDGQFGVDFTFPDDVRQGSAFIESCEMESLGSLNGYTRRSGRWLRECGDDPLLEGYAQYYRFSLDDWAFVRLELASSDDVFFNLLRDNDSANAMLDFSASDHLEGGHGVPDDSQLYWAHTPLTAGKYVVEIVTRNHVLPGDFTFTVTAQPTTLPPYRFKTVSATGGRTCGLLMDGTPLCWGRRGVEGQGSETPSGKFMSISTGGHTCALREDGTPVCWDFKEEGEHTCRPKNGAIYCRLNDQVESSDGFQSRDGATVVVRGVGVTGGYYDQTPPAGEKLSFIDTGWVHSCGLREDGTPICWGSNQYGKASPPPGERFVSIDAGTSHSCGVRVDGSAVCWGDDLYGQSSPPEGEHFMTVNAGERHSCGLRQDGTILCWGGGGLRTCIPQSDGFFHCRSVGIIGNIPPSPPESEAFGVLGAGSAYCGLRTNGSAVCWSQYQTGLASTPKDERFTTIASSDQHACALRQNGTAVCWGWNRQGQASPPSGVYLTSTDASQPPSGLVSISTGSYHTCGLDSDGYAVCWGPNWWNGRFSDQLVSIVSGEAHSCGLRPDGTVVCRGSDGEGQSSPPPNETFVSISSGFTHTCGLRADGTVACWGRHDLGQTSPPAGEVFVSIDSGGIHVCGLREDGASVCWGANGTGQASPPAAEVFSSVSGGGFHTCALRIDGTPVCWGLDRDGQISPPEGESFASLSSGGWHTCGLRADGTTLCWGADSSGQSSPPNDVTFISISSGLLHTCGLRADGVPVCWGGDDFGQASPRR